ncbi:Sfi1 spindle body domain containing protein [Lactarius tabidus]
MSNHFAPARSSTPPNSYPPTLVQRSAVSDVSRSSAVSAPELAKLTPDEVEFLDAVISRAPPSATTFIHIFKAYNDVISERGLDAENEVDYYKKLLKIGTLKGENWASKWRTVRTQNGYSEASAPSRAKPPLRKPITTPTPAPRIQTQPLSRAAPGTSRPQSSTARLLQRLKTLQREEPVEPSESAPDDLLSQTDITDAGTDSLSPTEPLPARGRSSSELTADNNTLGLDIGAMSSYPPSSTLAPSKATGWRWSERDLDIEKSVPFLTSTPPLPSHKLPSRPTPASIGQQISNLLPVNSTPRRPHADLHKLKKPAADEDEPWNKIRVAQDERTADRFRNARLLQRCVDVWKQGHDWVATTTIQVAHARDTFVLRVAIHKWRAALQHQREQAAHADARAKVCCQKTTLVRWHAHLQERQKAAWRADMRTRMHTVRSLRDAALRRDAWAHWRRLYQSRLLQQRVEARLVERCLVRWRSKLHEMEALQGRADEFVVMKEGRVVDRCWDEWRRTTELRSAERIIAEKVGARVVRESVVLWRQRTHEQQRADALHNLAVKRFAFNRWTNAYGRILALDRRADKQIARQEGALVRAVVRVWKAHERGHLLERVQHARVLRQAWEAWKRRLRHQGDLEAAALAFAQRSQVHVTSSAIQVWQRRFATQQGAQAFAVQYANAQLQFRILFKWRIQLRAHLKHFRQAKYADKLFVMRRAFRMWVQRSEEHGRETRLKEWNKGRAGKVFAGWKEKALRQRRRRLAEQHRGHIPLRSATMHLWWTTRSTAPSTSHNFPRGSSLLPFIFLALCRPLQWHLRILILMGKPRRDFLRRDTCSPLVI